MEVYEVVLCKDCTVPQDRIDPHRGSEIDKEHDDMLMNYSLCDVCGMDGSQSEMMLCGPCQHNNQKTLACTFCVDFAERRWVKTDMEHHRWQCAACK